MTVSTQAGFWMTSNCNLLWVPMESRLPDHLADPVYKALLSPISSHSSPPHVSLESRAIRVNC